MKEQIIKIIGHSLDELNMFVDDVFFSDEEDGKTLNIVLDSEEVIDSNRITDASKIINELIDENDPINESYILDIYSKEKGEENE